MVFLGDRPSAYSEILSTLSNRILIVVGANDEVSSVDSIFALAPEETGLAVLQIPGLGHSLSTRGWIQWKSWITSCIATFLRSHAKSVVKDKTFQKTAAMKELLRHIDGMQEGELQAFLEQLRSKQE